MNDKSKENSGSEPTQAPYYSLEMLFDGSQVSATELKNEIERAIEYSSSEVRLEVSATSDKCLLLSLKSSLEVIDICHHRINDRLLNRLPWPCIRLVDEAGDEARLRAYPILARIEQRLRAFISARLVEVLGFDWWNRFAPRTLQNEVESIARDSIELHSLEATQFTHLLDIITEEVSQWPEERALTAGEFLELLAQGNSLDEVKAQLQEKLKKFSFWDSVFARYFKDKEQWHKAKNSLKGVVTERHKVMHHRPLRLGAVHALEAKDRELEALLKTAKPKLSEQERGDVQRVVGEVMPIYERTKSFLEISSAMPPRTISEIAERLQSIYPDAQEARRQAEKFAASLPTQREINAMVAHAQEMVDRADVDLRRVAALVPGNEELRRVLQIAQSNMPDKQLLEEFESRYRLFNEQYEVIDMKSRVASALVPQRGMYERIEQLNQHRETYKRTMEQVQHTLKNFKQ